MRRASVPRLLAATVRPAIEKLAHDEIELVIVAVPARDEAADLWPCLASIDRAAARAGAAGC